MKKILIILFLTVFFVIGWILIYSSDYKGFIVGVRETSLIITTPTSDPRDDYPTYEIFLSEDTEIVGNRDRINDFRPGDEVRVWIEDKSKAKKIARKIIIDLYGNNPSSTGMH